MDAVQLPPSLAQFDCRNNRLALLGLEQDDFAGAVHAAVARHGAQRVGVFIGTSTSGILQTELAYRRRVPETGALVLRNVWAWLHWEALAQRQRGGRRLPVEEPTVKAMLLMLLAVAVERFGLTKTALEEHPIPERLRSG